MIVCLLKVTYHFSYLSFLSFLSRWSLEQTKKHKKRVPLWNRRPWLHHCIKMRWNCRLQRAALFAAECRFLVGLAVQHLPAAKTCKEVVLLCYVFQIESNPYKKLRTLMCFLIRSSFTCTQYFQIPHRFVWFFFCTLHWFFYYNLVWNNF